ncbi:MAG: Uma2 family endonuclease [Defluviitaleaceae bacterium]|nr:Uma2 family endonuclease [Defluviitaleaceae bacterium]
MFTQMHDMANYPRHGEILERLIGMVYNKYFQSIMENKIKNYAEKYALAHQGDRYNPNHIALPMELYNVNLKNVDENVLAESKFVEPDFMLFSQNKLQKSTINFKMAGCPDLIVEVWSKSNTKAEREILFDLYSTSNITEFWQIEQDSNEVITSIGGKFLPTQNLQTPLKTQAGLEIDLTSIANK